MSITNLTITERLLRDLALLEVPTSLLDGIREAVGVQLADDVASDPVEHPSHYTGHPSGVECIMITEHMGFNLGNAVKYIWRADLKGNQLEDLKKAAWYVQREIERLTPADDGLWSRCSDCGLHDGGSRQGQQCQVFHYSTQCPGVLRPTSDPRTKGGAS